MSSQNVLDIPGNFLGQKIYSKSTVIGFSILMSPLFGGVLLYKNLIEAGNQKEALRVLLISGAFTVVAIAISIPWVNIWGNVLV